jgi:hypothetical protein
MPWVLNMYTRDKKAHIFQLTNLKRRDFRGCRRMLEDNTKMCRKSKVWLHQRGRGSLQRRSVVNNAVSI